MERFDASLQRGGQGWCQRGDESAAPAERGPDFRGAGDPYDHPLKMEDDLATAGRGGDGSGEEP